MWTARPAEVRKALHLASIPVVTAADGCRGELRAMVEAGSAEDAVAKVRTAVGRNAAIPSAEAIGR
jgi:hypothetical protein